LHTLKVRRQVAGSQYAGFGTLRGMWAAEGVAGPWRGLPFALHRQVLFGGTRLVGFSLLRDAGAAEWRGGSFAVGWLSSAAGIVLANPTEVCLTRVQAAVGRRGGAGVDAKWPPIRQVYRECWPRRWAGLGTNVGRNSIVSAIEMSGYVWCKQALLAAPWWTKSGESPLTHAAAAVGSAFMAATIANPVDTVKVRLQDSQARLSPLTVARDLVAAEGVRGLYRGWLAHFGIIGSFGIVVWVSMESMLAGLAERRRGEAIAV
jgi:hypothetical protein